MKSLLIRFILLYWMVGETDDDYAVFTSMLEANKWGDNNCKYDYTVKTSKMF